MSKAKEILEKAKKTATSRKELQSTLQAAGAKLKHTAMKSPEVRQLREKLETLLQMMRMHLSGEYKAFSSSSIVLMAFALLYFVIPTDMIPDFIPAIGFTDDATVVMLIARKLNRDINRFNEWIKDQTTDAVEIQ